MQNEDQIDAVKGDDRLPYQRPDLLEVGQIADITLSTGNDPGGDGAYS